MIRTTLKQAIQSLPLSAPKDVLFSCKLGNTTLQAITPFAKGSYQYRMQALKVGAGIGLFGLGSFLWAKEKTTAAIKDAYREGLFDINTLNLRDWIIETNPTQEDICNAFNLAIENNHPQTMNFLLQKYSFSQKELESFFMCAIHNKRADCLRVILESKDLSPIDSTIEKEALEYILNHDLADCLEVLMNKAEREYSSLDLSCKVLSHFEQALAVETAKIPDILLREMKEIYALAKQLPSDIKESLLSIIKSIHSIATFTVDTASETASFTAQLAYAIANAYLDIFKIIIDSVNETVPKSSDELLLIFQENMEIAEKKVDDLINSVITSTIDSIKNAPNHLINSVKKIDLTPSDSTQGVLNNILYGTTKHKQASIALGQALQWPDLNKEFVARVLTGSLDHKKSALDLGEGIGKKIIDLLDKIRLFKESLSNRITTSHLEETPQMTSDTKELSDIEKAVLEMIQEPPASASVKQTLSLVEKMELTVKELAHHKSPKCLAVLEKHNYLEINSTDEIRQSMKDAISCDNIDHLKALFKNRSAGYLQDQDLKAILTEAIHNGAVAGAKFLLSQRHLTDESMGEMLILSAKEGHSQMVDLFLLSANRIPQHDLLKALLEAAKWPRPHLGFTILENHFFIKDEKVISSFFTAVVNERYGYYLDAFLASSYANLISPDTLCLILQKSLEDKDIDLIDKLIKCPVFSKISREEHPSIFQSLEALKQKQAAQKASHENLESVFADKAYARKALIDLCAHSSPDTVRQLLNLKEYSTISLEVFLEAFDSAKSCYREDNIKVLLQSPAYKKLSPEEFEKAGRADISATVKEEAVPGGPSIWQTITSSVYSIWQTFEQQRKDPNFTPAIDKENKLN